MKVMGKNGLGSILKTILVFGFIVGIMTLIAIPIIQLIIGDGFRITLLLFYYPCAIAMLVFTKQFIDLFDSLKQEKPFCKENITRLKIGSIASGIIFIEMLIATIFEIVIVHYDGIMDFIIYVINNDLGFMFLTILFFGVSIALYILSELFKQANDYKSENELTI